MYYRQPRYFGDFHCIGSECTNNCCYGWRINWEAEEVEKVKHAPNCSAELKELIEKSFIPNEVLDDQFAIKFDDRGLCPCVTEDGLCRIQKELGAEYLSGICMDYPRRRVATDTIIYRSCRPSCREVTKRLFSDEKAMDLINIQIKEAKSELVIKDTPETLASNPELKYRGELLEFFYELISDKKHDIETNIILGALAAQSLTKLVAQGEIDRIPEALKSFKSQMHNGAQLKAIENIKPNYHLRFGFIEKLLIEIVGQSVVSALSDTTGTPNIDHYNVASRRLEERFKDRSFFLRNIALNLLFEFVIPFKFPDKTIFENYSLFVVSYACIKLNLISIELLGETINVNSVERTFHFEGEDRFIGLTSIICREICQNETKQKDIIARLNENKFTSPAYLALLVK